MLWKGRYMQVLLHLFQNHPEFKLTFQGFYLTWLWDMLNLFQPEKVGFPYSLGRIIGKTLYLEGKPGESLWETTTAFERYAYLRYLERFFGAVDRHRWFTLRYIVWPPFRYAVQRDCFKEIICAYVERQGIVSRVTKIHLADSLWNTANRVPGVTWMDVFNWVDEKSWEAFRTYRHSPKGARITLE